MLGARYARGRRTGIAGLAVLGLLFSFAAATPASATHNRYAAYVDVAETGHKVAGDRNDVFGDAILTFLGTLDHAPLRQ